MSLREELWERVRPQIQEYRLHAVDAAVDGGFDGGFDDTRRVASEMVQRHQAREIDLSGRMLTADDRAWLDAQIEALLGAGPLEKFLRRDDVENIYCFGPGLTMLALTGGRQEFVTEPVFEDADAMVRYIAHLAASQGQTGRRFDQSAPLLDLRLASGDRIFAAMSICEQPYLTVRCHRVRSVDLDFLVERKSMSAEAAEFLAALVRPPLPANILVCGALGVGKTTLLRALLAEIGPSEVICTLEQTFELFLGETHPLTFAVETREPNSDGSGEIDMDELANRALRSSTDRMIVGELRGSEAATFLFACGTGSDGSMATIHASSPGQALSRMVRYCMAAGIGLTQSSYAQEVGDLMHLVVHLRNDTRTGFRGVSAISEVVGIKNERFVMHDIFARPVRGGPLVCMSRPRNREVIERAVEGGCNVDEWPESGRGG